MQELETPPPLLVSPRLVGLGPGLSGCKRLQSELLSFFLQCLRSFGWKFSLPNSRTSSQVCLLIHKSTFFTKQRNHQNLHRHGIRHESRQGLFKKGRNCVLRGFSVFVLPYQVESPQVVGKRTFIEGLVGLYSSMKSVNEFASRHSTIT